MILNGLAKVAFQVIPKCAYTLHTTDLENTAEDCEDLFDERGLWIGHDNKTSIEIMGIMSGITKETQTMLPDKTSAEGFITLTTDVSLPLPGVCVNDYRSRYVIELTDGSKYLLKSRKLRGCLYTYLGETVCGPDCD